MDAPAAPSTPEPSAVTSVTAMNTTAGHHHPSPLHSSTAQALQRLHLHSTDPPRENGVNPSTEPSPTSSRQPRPPIRRVTDPSPTSPSMLAHMPATPPPSRNRSPYSRSHLRSRSTSSTSSAPPMTRAKSSPGSHSMGYTPIISPASSRPASPYRSAVRGTSPLRYSTDESAICSTLGPSVMGAPDIESISEDSELDLTPRMPIAQPPPPQHGPTNSPPLTAYQHSGPGGFPRRRRPSSPLHQVLSVADVTAEATAHHTPTSTPSTGSGTPATPFPPLNTTRFNESFPTTFLYASSVSSSVPSTPTSTRSRSPSISSLETIPDSPDAEQQAAIEEEEWQQQQQRQRQQQRGERPRNLSDGDCGTDLPRRASLDAPDRGRAGARNDKRKRWSVCGAERRGDIDLETIWED